MVPGGRPQYVFDLAAVLGVLDEAIAGQLVRQQARLAAAHRVGLAGQRERPGAGLADLPGQQVQVDEAVVLPHADRALVQPHAVEAQEARRPGDAAGRPSTSRSAFDAGHARTARSGPGRAGSRGTPRSRWCAAATKRVVDSAALEQQPAEGVEQGDVAAGGDRHVQVGVARRSACAAGRRRSSDVRPGLALRGADAVEGDRVRLGHVAADDEDHVGAGRCRRSSAAARRCRGWCGSRPRRRPCTAGCWSRCCCVPR